VTVLIDDHLLRDWLAGPDRQLRAAVRRQSLATTNLWYARLCKSAARSTGGALLGRWDSVDRAALVSALVALPEEFELVPMRELAWRMGMLASEHDGLSTLGSEAVAAAESLGAGLLVSSRDDSPGIRRCCRDLGLRYRTLAR
jgi:hypothetical protein